MKLHKNKEEFLELISIVAPEKIDAERNDRNKSAYIFFEDSLNPYACTINK